MRDVLGDWWRGGVIYQIYPRSFYDLGDGIGDLIGHHRGSTTSRASGVDAIWISPFFVSPMDDFGYDVSPTITNVDPMFGTLEDFDAARCGPCTAASA
jgi:alpha-glucosidase